MRNFEYDEDGYFVMPEDGKEIERKYVNKKNHEMKILLLSHKEVLSSENNNWTLISYQDKDTKLWITPPPYEKPIIAKSFKKRKRLI